ncbi:hypothetical protein CGLAMM_07360 [Acetobacteraceae bacterium EV16G]|uniref:Uncharacterized protein n=1 Tax=Sorlinia euscelidii TaxID=3081148 RepID=A0ABU7U4S3_9PROT
MRTNLSNALFFGDLTTSFRQIDKRDVFPLLRARIGFHHGAQMEFARAHGLCHVRVNQALNSVFRVIPNDILEAAGISRVEAYFDLRGTP